MLAFCFFSLVFSSLLWLIFSVRYVFESLHGLPFFDAGVVSIISYVVIVCLPIFLIWLIFSFISQYLNGKAVNLRLQKLFEQVKRNQEYSDLLSRVLIEAEQQIKDGFMLNKFDLLLADMNELLAEIIRCCNIASAEQIEHLWNKVQNGGKWSFGKVIVEVNGAQPNFQKRVYDKACKDLMLAGTLMEFCARYQATVSMLEKHDKEKVFLNIIEAGIMGKVFSIFAPVADGLRRNREASEILRENTPSFQEEVPSFTPNFPPKNYTGQRLRATARHDTKAEEDNEPLLSKLNLFKKKKETPAMRERDPFSIALEKSFGSSTQEEVDDNERESFFREENFQELRAPSEFDETIEPDNTPHFDNDFQEHDEDVPQAPKIEAPKLETVSITQKKLDSLRKEWEELRATDPQMSSLPEDKESKKTDETEEELNVAYPFGSWVDENNYK